MSVTLQSSITTLRGIDGRTVKKLKELGIETIQDILFHLPSRYEDHTRITPLGNLRHGDQAMIEGEVTLTKIIFRHRRMMICKLADDTGSITLRFFHFSQSQKNALSQGSRLRCYGETRNGFNGLEMVHPKYQRIANSETRAMEESLTAVYPTIEGVHQLTIRKLVSQVLALIQRDSIIHELIPPELYHGNNYTLAEALQYLHQPPPDAPIELMRIGQHPCQQRMAFEELLAHNVSLKQLRRRIHQYAAPQISGNKHLYQKLCSQLGFDLTDAQLRVITEITADLQKSRPMMRLVQGDVGSGKTVVAATIAVQVIGGGYQVALMAPTEILAEQHFRNLDNWLTPLDIKLGWLSGKQKEKVKQQSIFDIKNGNTQLVVGTHALFQDKIVFNKLGLIIVDEQHRFGVHQRLKLMQKGIQNNMRPHQMIMTATPIPRTLAMSAYSDLDTSIIDELPAGRQPVTTIVVPEERRDDIIQRVAHACSKGRQAYWVCPLIEESETLQAQAATDTRAILKERLPNLRIQLIHGRLKPMERDQIMQTFKDGDIDLLVATTVVEVGIDIPNASLMIMENAERLGLSQLHQLRGRIGRGKEQGSCVLMYKSPLGNVARKRLGIMRKTTDGFEIAKYDLEIRGPGEVLGTRQTGIIDFRIADLVRDQKLMPGVIETSKVIFEKYPEIIEPLLNRWIKQRLRFAEV